MTKVGGVGEVSAKLGRLGRDGGGGAVETEQRGRGSRKPESGSATATRLSDTRAHVRSSGYGNYYKTCEPGCAC